jgi:hypothetical protein
LDTIAKDSNRTRIKFCGKLGHTEGSVKIPLPFYEFGRMETRTSTNARDENTVIVNLLSRVDASAWLKLG